MLKQITKYIFILFFLPLLLNGQDRALLIGIDDYKSVKRAKGCVNDTKMLKVFLMKEYGFKEKQIKILTNEQATKNNILKELDNLIAATSPGSRVFFSYSGHGTQKIDYSKKEIDKQTKAIVPYDAFLKDNKDGYRNLVLSSELKKRFQKLSSRRMAALFDCCYAGTLARSLQDEADARFLLNPQLLNPENKEYLYDETHDISNDNILNELPLETPTGYLIYLYACRSEQKAYPIQTKNGMHGVLTYSFCNTFLNRRIIKENRIELLKFARTEIEKSNKNINQDPYCEAGINLMSIPLFSKASHSNEILSAALPLNKKSGYKFAVNTFNGKKEFYFAENKLVVESEAMGDELHFAVQTNKAGYLFILLYDRDHKKWRLIVPEGKELYNIKPGVNKFPDEMSGIRLTASPPEGAEKMVFLIVSDPKIIIRQKNKLENIDSEEKLKKYLSGLALKGSKEDWQAFPIEILVSQKLF